MKIRIVASCFVRHIVFALLVLAPQISLPSTAKAAAKFQPGSGFTEDVVFGNLPAAAAIAFAPDNRVFIALKSGIVRVAQDGAILPTPFIDISSIVNNSTDRGLLSVIAHPQFPVQPYVYLFFTYDPPGATPDERTPRVARLIRVTADSSKQFNVAVPNSSVIILGANSTAANTPDAVPPEDKTIPEKASCMTNLNMDGVPIDDCLPSDAAAHTVGALVFGTDGSLYASLGDGASYDTATKLALRAQNIDSLAGKILRIDPNTGNGLPGNPYYEPQNPSSNRSRVWARGMRNPFRITVDPSTDQPFIGDVGSSTWEEVNAGKGANFGWPCYEGGVAPGGGTEGGNTASNPSASFSNFSRTKDFCAALFAQGAGAVTRAVFSYKHPFDAAGNDLGAAITGVAFYSGHTYPAQYRNALFIADFVQTSIRYLTFDGNGYPTAHNFSTENGTGLRPVQLITGPDTNIYVMYLDLHHNLSEVRRIRYNGVLNSPPLVTFSATPRQGLSPLNVSFRSDGTLDPDGQQLTLTWDFGDGSGSSAANPAHLYNNPGSYQAVLTATETTSPFASSSKTDTIRVGVEPPRAVITSPAAGTLYKIGDNISFAGYGIYQNAPLPEENLSWSILQHHNTHEHLITEILGASGSFVPTEHSDDTFYELCLEALSPDNVDDVQCIALNPERAEYTFTSDPIGMEITYVDEQKDVLTPHVAHPIVNASQTIVAPVISGSRTFVGWDDGVTTSQRTFIVEPGATTFTALYENRAPQAVINASKLSGPTPLVVTFDGSESSDPEGDLLTYSWTFGSQNSSAAIVKKTFSTAGSIPVTLTVTDKLGQSSTAQVEIEATVPVKNQPPVLNIGLPQTVDFGQPVFLDGNATDDGLPKGVLTYRWVKSAGPGTVVFQNSKSASTMATFSKPGTYVVKLEVSDSKLKSNLNTLVTVNPIAPAQAITSFSLIDANTDDPIPGYEQILNGTIIELSTLAASAINIRANTSPSEVGSVKFLFDGKTNYSIDSVAPYALKTDNKGDFPAWPVLKKRYLITAIPYTNVKGQGAAGAALSLEIILK